MGGAPSRRKNKAFASSGSGPGAHLSAKRLAAAATSRHHDHHHWLSQRDLNAAINGAGYPSAANPAPSCSDSTATAGGGGGGCSGLYLNEHDSITYTSSLANLRTPSPELSAGPAAFAQAQSAATNVHHRRRGRLQLDSPDYNYHALAQRAPPPPPTTNSSPIYEHADVYIEPGGGGGGFGFGGHNVATFLHASCTQLTGRQGAQQAAQAAQRRRRRQARAFQAAAQLGFQAEAATPAAFRPHFCAAASSNEGHCDCDDCDDFGDCGHFDDGCARSRAPASAHSGDFFAHQWNSSPWPASGTTRHAQQDEQPFQVGQFQGSSSRRVLRASQTTLATRAQRGRKLLIAQLRRAQLERGLAMGEEDRASSGRLGLVAPAVRDQALEARAVMNFIENCKDELAKYMYLRNLKDFNENLFYFALMNNVEKLMPIVYTPTVGLACEKFSEIYMRPRGLFVTANDLGRVRRVVANWPARDVRVLVVTDGERILGLGDLGANGMGISIGKLSLYTALAGIPPQNVLPVTIDVGTNNEFNLKDPYYIGLRQRRLRGAAYDQLIEEFMQAVVERWGRSCLIQFEDFANSTAFVLLERYRNHYCTFNDDIQGTASVSLAGLLTAARLTNKRLADCSFLFYGAGEANLGTANLLVMAMEEEGLGREEAKRRIFLVDSKGLVVKARAAELSGHKLEFAQEAEHLRDLEAIVDLVRPTALIGASAQGGSFSESICKRMAEYNERPIIFALSNPTSKAECTAAQAYAWTRAKCVFASGSPFAPVQLEGRTYVTGQGNNAYIFPGVGLAAIAAHTHLVPEQIFLVAARALSDQVTEADLEVGLVYPSLSKIREVTLRVATRCLEHFYAERLANYCPEPADKEEFLRSLQYDPRY